MESFVYYCKRMKAEGIEKPARKYFMLGLLVEHQKELH